MAHLLPQEIYDLIIDHLHDERFALKACCLVSRGWIQRARKHLFVHIKFNVSPRSVSRWLETFPDPTNSPAPNARALSIHYSKCLRARDIKAFPAFPNVIYLNVETDKPLGYRTYLHPLHRISTVIRSLRFSSCCSFDSDIFVLICSLPLLEDLSLSSPTPQPTDKWTRPRTSPRLTGSLELVVIGGIQSAINRLLDLPNGLHFKKIVVRLFSTQNIESATHLVSGCSDTLESLSIVNVYPPPYLTPSIDLSKATKLRDVEFLCHQPNIRWIAETLSSLESKNIHQISIGLFRRDFMPLSSGECSDLDSLLVHLWTSRSIRLKVMHEPTDDPEGVVARLLPQSMSVAVVDVVECPRIPPPTSSLGTTFW